MADVAQCRGLAGLEPEWLLERLPLEDDREPEEEPELLLRVLAPDERLGIDGRLLTVGALAVGRELETPLDERGGEGDRLTEDGVV